MSNFYAIYGVPKSPDTVFEEEEGTINIYTYSFMKGRDPGTNPYFLHIGYAPFGPPETSYKIWCQDPSYVRDALEQILVHKVYEVDKTKYSKKYRDAFDLAMTIYEKEFKLSVEDRLDKLEEKVKCNDKDPIYWTVTSENLASSTSSQDVLYWAVVIIGIVGVAAVLAALVYGSYC